MTRPGRQAVVAVYRATFPSVPDWPEGPLPLAHDGVTADAAGRSTYYPARTARLLYGTPERARRWHKAARTRSGGIDVTGVEALRVEEEPGGEGLVVLHLDPRDLPVLDVVRGLSGRPGADLRGFDPADALDGRVRLLPAAPFVLTFVTSRGRRLPRLYGHPRYLRWPALDQWLWALASRSDHTDQPPDPRVVRLTAEDRIRVSADWCGLVLREGMALVGTRPDQGRRDPFYNHAALYARTLYLDAILIGLLQLHGIGDLEDGLAGALDGERSMAGLERRLTLFRHRLWWQHLSTHGAPNQILDAFHRNHRLPERFAQILAEINDYNRLTRDDEARDINNAVVLFTLVTVPAGIALALLQVLGSKDPWLFAAVMAAFAVLTGLLLLTRPARLVRRGSRRRLSR
jgi:hypothetical protein